MQKTDKMYTLEILSGKSNATEQKYREVQNKGAQKMC